MSFVSLKFCVFLREQHAEKRWAYVPTCLSRAKAATIRDEQAIARSKEHVKGQEEANCLMAVCGGSVVTHRNTVNM